MFSLTTIMHRNRQALVKRGDATFRDKQESLDLLEFLEAEKIPVYGVEIVKLSSKSVETDMYKTVWYQDQKDVYHKARVFIKEKMGGAWNYAEFKL
jgi:hypothetical protein